MTGSVPVWAPYRNFSSYSLSAAEHSCPSGHLIRDVDINSGSHRIRICGFPTYMSICEALTWRKSHQSHLMSTG